ncbi:TPM domain-containing protein [Candidatus Enterococcus leclercqii]|uniref:TPM domain-containing protein n=1 Tax=Candidatus Enterococcus leclercqii TaxID=1857218 RepID=UPI00137B8FCB|nr:TPM domain-containing protein [Enterococcus sp. CU9D]KAF1294197.1 hypothetical protein BAU14_07350 [Enterococcus sp. CU9D]
MEKQRFSSGLDDRITSYYRKLKKRGGLLMTFAGIVALICGTTIIMAFIQNDSYQQQQADYQSKINKLQQDREDILSGKTQPFIESFDDTLNERLAALGDYPTNENNVSIPINGTEGTIVIDKNNIFVSDNAGMLSDKTKQHLYDLNKQLAASTDGAQLEVVTIKELPRGENIEGYANSVFNQLGIGSKSENNGVLYLIDLDDQKFRLEVGYGLEGVIPDAIADDIINNEDVVDLFRDEKYDDAVTKVVNQVFGIMNTKTVLVDAQIEKVSSVKSNASLLHWGALIFLVALVLGSLSLAVALTTGQAALGSMYKDYQRQNKDRFRRQTDLYYIMKSGLILALTAGAARRALTRGKLLQYPRAKRMPLGRVLIGDTLYSGNGNVLTTAYLASKYNSSNWSSNDSSSGGSWGSFGGGSSGGGGASGGW